MVGLTAEEVGLSLDDAKAVLAELQRHILRTQMEEYATCARVCRDCLRVRRRRDGRTRLIQTLFGTVVVDAPRFSACPCRNTFGFHDVSVSPLAGLLPDRCTPELRRVQAELGARHSFREAARLLSALLPCSPPNHATVRNRTRRIAMEVEALAPVPPAAPAHPRSEIVVIDGAHFRAVPGQQSRHLGVTVGKVEVFPRLPRRFAFAPRGAADPVAALRAALVEQGWAPGRPLTVVSDGEPALPNLVRAATGGPVEHVLDWFHLAMRIRTIEQILPGLASAPLRDEAPVRAARVAIERTRHLLWHGRPGQADEELIKAMNRAADIPLRNDGACQEAVLELRRRYAELRAYVGNNADAVAYYHRRYDRLRPISTSRAEGCVDEIANARMGKRRKMRWSAAGANAVALVRAAVLDGRLETAAYARLAA